MVLTAADEAAHVRAHALVRASGYPCALFTDESQAGVRSVTCLGLGPLLAGEGRDVTGELPRMK